MLVKARRRYTEELKIEAVRLVWESAHPVAQVARDLGIPENVLYRWRTQHQQAEAHGTTRVPQRAEAEELTRVKREVARRIKKGSGMFFMISSVSHGATA